MATQNKREHLTEDLLKRLLASSSIDAYLDEGETIDQTLPSYLRCLIDERRIKRSDVARNSGLNPTVVYDIFAGKSRPGRDHAIMLALGIGCTLRETQRLLRLDSVAELWCKDRRDAIIIWCVERGMSRACTDDELYRLGEKTLLGTNPLKLTPKPSRAPQPHHLHTRFSCQLNKRNNRCHIILGAFAQLT